MNDLVERLEWAAEEFYRRHPGELLREAAEEVRRLRAEAQETTAIVLSAAPPPPVDSVTT
jgi:hypothetical protein